METFIQSENRTGGPVLLFIESWMKPYPKLSVGFSSRLGGVSQEPFDSLNCALHVHDDSSLVIANRLLVADQLDIPFGAWTCAEQVHSNEIQIITETEKGAGRASRTSAIQAKDGMLTNVPGIWLTSFYADCVPLYFYDPVQAVIGLAHAGWKGTVLDIAGQMIRTMIDAYGCRAKDILTGIGPSIDACCYEVDQTVVDHVDALQLDKITYKVSQNGKYMLNLKQVNKELLIKAGILPEHIEVSEWCTSCNTDLFYSHRKEQGKTGRMMSWITLKSR